jgi:hypothetical protein
MGKAPLVVLRLPGREEIEVTEETCVNQYPGVIRKEVRYKNGIKVVFYQDLNDDIYRVSVDSSPPLRMSKNRILRTKTP